MSKPYRSIVIVGGGTSGWLSACYLQRTLTTNPDYPIDIRLIESEEIGTIGVGEATIPKIGQLLTTLDIPENRLFTDVDTTLKNGIRFVGWKNGGNLDSDVYDHPFDVPALLDSHNTMTHWMNLKTNGLTDTSFATAGIVQTALFDHNKSPKVMTSENYDAPISYAYHLDATKLAKLLKEVSIERGVQHIVGTVESVQSNDDGIESVTLADGSVHSADLFIDCSGFRSILMEGALDVPWHSYKDTLLCDRAIACPVAFESADTPIRTYTTSTAKDAGWIWEIDLQSRRGTGYVYSSKYCSDDEAINTLRQHNGKAEPLAEPRILHMKIGRREKMWEKNCLAIGLSAGFIEPLESTGLFLVQHAIQTFIDYIPASDNCTHSQDRYNKMMNDTFDDLHDFVLMHYVLSGRRDTPFWRDYTEQVKIPSSLSSLLELWKEKIPQALDFNTNSTLFGAHNWFFILSGLNYLPSNGIAQTAFIPIADSQHALEYIAQVRETALKQSPSMRDYLQKVLGAIKNAPKS